MYGKRSEHERCAVAAIGTAQNMTGIVLCADGPIANEELKNSTYIDDWIVDMPPKCGIWVWDGAGYLATRGYDGEWSDPSLDGEWRRPTEHELSLLANGQSPWGE